MSQSTYTEEEKPRNHRRQATVYDAVAGRVGPNGFLRPRLIPAHGRDAPSYSRIPLPPDEVLFGRKNAPTRYEENDIYFAHRNLDSREGLPDSDLLKALHAYASDFYSNSLNEGGESDFRSMDGTSLLALGILMEEAAHAALGESGDLALIEGEDQDHIALPGSWDGSKWRYVRDKFGNIVVSEGRETLRLRELSPRLFSKSIKSDNFKGNKEEKEEETDGDDDDDEKMK